MKVRIILKSFNKKLIQFAIKELTLSLLNSNFKILSTV